MRPSGFLSLRFAGTLAVLALTAALSAQDTNSAGIQYLGHVGVGVSDVARALHFYEDQLGLTEVFKFKKKDGTITQVYLRVNDNNFVELFPGATEQGQFPRSVTGIRHLGFFVKDLQQTLHTLAERGYPLPADAFEQAKKVRADGTLLYFLKDPDGNNIELSQILPDSDQAKSRKGR
ncbi:MAG: VOC family protein [Bryobacteraceae bacterium]